MKTLSFILSCLAVILLFGLTVSAVAQEDEETRKASNAITLRAAKTELKGSRRSAWNGNYSDFVLSFLEIDDAREGIGVSKEQVQKIQDIKHGPYERLYETIQNDPNYKSIQEEMLKLARTGGPYMKDASEETQKKYFDLMAKSKGIVEEKKGNLINEILTPEQMKKIKEFQISLMPRFPIVSPNMFEALDLSDAQKKQFDEIKKEMEPEFEKAIDMHTESDSFPIKLSHEIDEKLKDVTDPQERQRLEDDLRKEAQLKGQQLCDEAVEYDKGFVNRLKFKMFDVLTDEQMKRMADLIDNPPDYVKKNFWRNTIGEWTPGPDSWKPGDGIPEEYIKHREEQRRFPRRK